MSTQAIVKMGSKHLGVPSTPLIDFDSVHTHPEIATLLQNMRDTMEEKGGVGITAPQVGCNKRIIMLGFEKSKRYPNAKPVPFTILINPSYKVICDEMVDGWEGCLSLPCLRGLVSRYKKIEYSGYDAEGNLITGIAEGFHARIIQHECDHLDGILFTYRLKDLHEFGYEDELGPRIFNY
ncbi:peptide deformylase [Legionella rowbothamii]|uniref:peptide deformylase n=1 Tax=Legionella rowbothamii TaxID=96229 RepID=UPI001054ED91|nr:peptide deformylase [Legionella rowbothamii]